MKLLVISFLFITNATFASTMSYDLKIDLSMNGKHISSPRIIVKAGEAATITQKTDTEESFIEVVAHEGEIQSHKGIMLNFVVGLIGKNGQKTIVSRPQILALENKKAQITVSEKEGGPEQLSLSVIAQRKVQ